MLCLRQKDGELAQSRREQKSTSAEGTAREGLKALFPQAVPSRVMVSE